MPALILAYPVLAHLGIILHRPLLQWLALCCLVAVPLYEGLRGGRPRHWVILLGAVALLFLLTRAGGGKYLLFLPPVFLPAVGAWFFGSTLRKGQVPLITRMARATRSDELPAELLPYTRKVTGLWTLALAGLALWAAALAVFAPLPLWSLFTNFIDYLILAAIFPLEYLYRRLRFRHLEHPGFIGFIRSIASLNYRKL
ncbi:MAG: ketosynthase [Stenotrophobium sp.]